MSDSETTAAAEQAAEEAAARRGRARRVWLTRLGVVVAIAGVLWLGWYLIVGRSHVSTDDAYVDADMAQITPLMSASVVAVHVIDTQVVKAGTVLVELDPSDARIEVASAEADLAAAQRHFRQSQASTGALQAQIEARNADIAQAEAGVQAAQATLARARIDLSRREALAPSGGVSGEDLTNARTAAANAVADLAKAQAALAMARAGRTNATGEYNASAALVSGFTEASEPAVRSAQARLDAARLNLARTVIRAPIDGVVSRREVQVGQRVTQGVPIMTIVPQLVYVDANFKERQLGRVRAGEPAEVRADFYGGSVTYHGRVTGIGGATGAAMAIIPAQNATGNWIKVVQRLPVRIALDARELAEHPLRVGLSADVTIDVSGADDGDSTAR